VLSVRPGITDFASIEYRDEGTLLAQSSDPERTYREVILPTKLALQARYVDRSGLGTDLVLIGRTLWAIIAR
jgi:lipopolysaccharide/colanic/teichoic acid biosynthesis glycosyltransferase